VTVAPDVPVAIVTDRLVLRAPHLDDAPDLARIANDPRVAAGLRDVFPHPYTLSDARHWIAGAEQRHPLMGLLITVQDTPIGGIGLVPGDDVTRFSAEVGYWLGVDHWGQGYATEALRAVCDHAFATTEFVRIFGCVFQGNEASGRVLEKSGFTLEGVQRKAVYKAGLFLDQSVYGRIRA
jgi:[ribosomal protein S5]-alanine N-acetyltransferase